MSHVQQAHTFTKQLTITVTRHYLLFLPKDYDPRRPERWPLVLFLHGMGERGDDLYALTRHGPPKLVEEGQDFPFLLLSPQCPTYGWWTWETNIAALAALLDEIETTYLVDPDQVYVTGLSMGGYGTWALATAYPHRFAAIAPICGGGDPSTVCAIRHLPVWAFHGQGITSVWRPCDAHRLSRRGPRFVDADLRQSTAIYLAAPTPQDHWPQRKELAERSYLS